MAVVDVLMPQMGESVMEGTVIQWLIKPGDEVEEEDSIIEIATDKVDTEIPCPYEGKIVELLCNEGDVVQVGSPIAKMETTSNAQPDNNEAAQVSAQVQEPKEVITSEPSVTQNDNSGFSLLSKPVSGRFYSPLVMNIAKKEGVDMQTLELIPGNGKDGRVTKQDILKYLDNRESIKSQPVEPQPSKVKESKPAEKQSSTPAPKKEEKQSASSKFIDNQNIQFTGDVKVVPMDRTREIIAQRMLESRKTSAHVTSIVEADVSNVVVWRNKWKRHFKEKEDTILTFTPIFLEAVIKAIKDYPKINASVDGKNIVYKKDINLGFAVALPTGNLVVPVIKKADQLNLVGLTKQVNDLAKRARNNKLSPSDLEGGTYTVSNVGSFGNLIGTPILVQPQVGILALGAVVKKPAVIETPYGDTIGIRHQMFLSHSYDHRIVDGSLGGMFVRRVADYLEKFDIERDVL